MTEPQAVPVDPLAVSRAAALGRQPVRVQLPLGTVDAGVVADVDPSGLVQLRGASWSVDWWIGAEDRWHHPSIDTAVRQHSIGGAPLVETAMRVPGGDVVQRCYGARARSVDDAGDEWSDSAVVIEVDNQTAVPVALAVVVRPVTLDGPGRVSSVEVDGSVIRVDGEVAAVLSKPAVRRSAGAPGAAARALHAGEDEAAEGIVSSSTGDLEAAFVVPLPHSTTVRVMLPRVEASARRARRATTSSPGEQWDAPDLEAAAKGWATHVRTLADVELPEPIAAEVCAASEQTLMLAATDDFFDGGTGVTAAQRAEELCDALVRVGLSQPLEPIVRALVDSQTLTGALKMADRSDATVALVHAATPLLTGARSEFWAEELVGPVARAVHRIERGKGLAPGSERSAAVALGRVAPALRVVDQPDVADAAAMLSSRLYAAAAGGDGGSTAAGSTDAAGGVTAAARRLRAQLVAGAAGVADVLSLLRVGLPGAVADVVDADGHAGGHRGLDPAAVAARLGLLLDLLVVEGPDGPVLLPRWADTWFGQACEAHRVRTRWGQVSFAVRWHGARPAILWEVEPGDGVDRDAPPVLRAPGLDPAWEDRRWEGEALLAEVPVPEAVVSLSGRSAPTIQPTTFELPDLSAPAPTPDEGQSFS